MSQKYLNDWIGERATKERYLFKLQNLRSLCPDLSDAAFKSLMHRSIVSNIFVHVCRGIYAYRKAMTSGLLLFHTAALLRSGHFNYLSLETVLSQHGVISQIPMSWISLMSSGRSAVISCGEFGTIEYVHTKRQSAEMMSHLTYDARYHMWCANVPLALRDMRATHRNMDLINWDVANEFI